MRNNIDKFESSDMGPLRKLMTTALGRAHPELDVKVADMTYNDNSVYVTVRMDLTKDVKKIAASRHMTLEKIGDYTLEGRVPGKTKQWVVRKGRDLVYAGDAFVKKLFEEKKGAE